jgi:hypothetical protein
MGKNFQLCRKVRILCTSGLPLYSLVTGLSHEIGRHIPFSPNALFLDSARPTCGVFLGKDMTHRAAPLHYFRSLPATETGIVPSQELVRNPEALIPPSAYFLPNFPDSEAYHEFYRLLGVHHVTAIRLRGTLSRYSGLVISLKGFGLMAKRIPDMWRSTSGMSRGGLDFASRSPGKH